MAQRDRYHRAVKNALVKDGWRITHDPYTVTRGRRNLFIDLGAEQFLAAERDDRKIAVEIKSFLGKSEMTDLHLAVGQYIDYLGALRHQDPGRQLILAVPNYAFDSIWSDEVGHDVLAVVHISMLVFDPLQEVIEKWLP